MSSKTPRQDSTSKPTTGRNRDPSTTKLRVTPPEGEGDGGGGGLLGATDVCDLLIDVDLEGVRSSALVGLNVGADLIVRLDRDGEFRSVVCVRPDGLIVGALSAFRNVSALISCLERSAEYAVRVTDIGAGFCHVRGGRVDQ